MIKWPKDTQAARNAFYGDPGKGEIAGQMVPVVPPFAMYYDGKRVKAIQFHKKAAPALLAALTEIWDACDHDQAKVDDAGVSKYAGAYNHRKVRGSETKWSNHAYAAAIDLNALENGLGQKGNMPQFVIDAFCRQGWMWGGWYTGRKDPMHFEAVDNGGRKPKNAVPSYRPSKTDTSAPTDEIHDEFERAEKSSPAVKIFRAVGIGTAGVTATSQLVSSVTGPVAETVQQVQEVVDTSGQLVASSKVIVSVVPAGFWANALAFVQSPKFLAGALIVVLAAWGATYFLRTRNQERRT
jgi:hypothetical protein